MKQESIEALVKFIMADQRILDLMNSSFHDSKELTLVETKADVSCLPPEWRKRVYCQEACDGEKDLLSYGMIIEKEWEHYRIFRPSLNFIAKLSAGIADEPILKLTQAKLIEGNQSITLAELRGIADIQVASYKKLFLEYVEKIKSYGIKVCGESVDGNAVASHSAGPHPEMVHSADPHPAASHSAASDTMQWQQRALTEKDLLDMKKGITITVGNKCIITSLAADMARRKGIQICREGGWR